MTIKVKQEITITRKILEDIFVTAIEGGSNYWSFFNDAACDKVRDAIPEHVDPCFSTAVLRAVLDKRVAIDVSDVETDEVIGSLDVNLFKRRLQDLFNDESCRQALLNMINEEGDASDADIVFQYLIMGEVVYG